MILKTVKKSGGHFRTGNTGNSGNMKLKRPFSVATVAATTGNKYFTNNVSGNKVATENVAKKIGLATDWQQYIFFETDSKIKSFIFKKALCCRCCRFVAVVSHNF